MIENKQVTQVEVEIIKEWLSDYRGDARTVAWQALLYIRELEALCAQWSKAYRAPSAC